jgi:Ca2+-binding RTX toxin-like protein
MVIPAGESYSQDDAADDWECPIDPAFDYETCMDVMANDPGYLSYEDSLVLSGYYDPQSFSIDGFNSCSYDSGSKQVTCEGDDNANTIYIGKTYLVTIPRLTVCLNNVPYQYPPADVNKVLIWGHGGDDRIQVLLDGESGGVSCGGPGWMEDFDPSWTATLTAYGWYGRDSIYGSQNNDWLYGQDGDDVVDGRGGNDYVNGQKGNDHVIDQSGSGSRLMGEDGMDDLDARDNTGYVYMYGGNQYDVYHAGSGGSWINDTSATATGNHIVGGAGADKIRGDNGPDWIEAGNGSDPEIYGYGGDDIIYADLCTASGGGVDYIWGGSGNDTIVGCGGNDVIYGEGEEDCIIGGYLNLPAGSYGDEGNDYLDGGSESDCVYCDSVWLYNDCTSPGSDYSWEGGTNDHAYGCDIYGICTNDCGPGAPGYCDNF